MARIYYLDHLRAIATLLLIPYHAACIFGWPDYYINGGELAGFEALGRLIDAWFMPLFFLIAGAAASLSLQRRTYSQFAQERFQRLMLPCIFGLILLMPFNGYWAYQNHYDIRLSLIEYLPEFLKIRDLAGMGGSFTVGHLWFLLYLTVFSLLAIPLQIVCFQPLSTLLKQKTPLAVSIGWGLVFCLLLCGARLLGLFYPNPIYFVLFYFLGLILWDANQHFSIFTRLGSIFIILGVATMIIFLYFHLAQPELTGRSWYESLRAFNAFLWTIGILETGRQCLNRPHQLLHWINQHGLTIYIIHLPIVNAIAYFIIDPINNGAIAWTLIVLLSTPFSLVLAWLIDSSIKRVKLRLYILYINIS